jgi:DNA-binding NarL/FixJ family response regulator
VCCLLITGFASDAVVEEAFTAGAHDILTKPIHVTEVLARVARAAELVCLRREVRLLRPAGIGGPTEGPTTRARELESLVALPGQAPPPPLTSREEIAQRLELLMALHRYGVLSQRELEEKRRAAIELG